MGTQLPKAYGEALRTYLAGADQAVLQRAHEIGRNVLSEPSDILAIISHHHEALRDATGDAPGAERAREAATLAEDFLKQTLSSIETFPAGFRGSADTNNAVIQFTGTLCHEIRTPLTSVLASAGMLGEMIAGRLEEQEEKLLANVLDGANRIRQRTDELMDLMGFYARSIALDRRQANLRDLLTGIMRRMEPVVARAGLKLQTHLHESIERIMTVDPERLEQVIGNLIHNAIKFGADGGVIIVRAEAKGALAAEIEDHGKGIPWERQERLFQPFYRASREGRNLSGLGLGLALCKEIISAHGGQIWLKSEEGKGTVVGFMIPGDGTVERPGP